MASTSTNTDFLKFSAYSIKDLITRKLANDSRFTDQIYEGSNLAVLIDLVSYMYQCLVAQLNSAASESMFSDTQIFENIIRLVNLIGYSPKGCTPASMYLYLNNRTDDGDYNAFDGMILPRFSYFETSLTDSNGAPICFSTGDEDVKPEGQAYKSVEFLNGRWHLYDTVFTASGVERETFVLDGIKSLSDEQKYVSSKHIKVFVESGGEFQDYWKCDYNEIFASYDVDMNPDLMPSNKVSFTTVYGNDEYTGAVYSVRMTEDHSYVIKFGDGVVGRKLNPEDRVYVWYLETNGPDGDIDMNDIQFPVTLRHSPSDFGVSKDLYVQTFGDNSKNMITGRVPLMPKSYEIYPFKPEEDVADIRQNAPEWFKTGNRLITRTDYEHWIRTNMKSRVADVKCMNNWEYMAQFFKWLYNWGVDSEHADGLAFINEENLSRDFQHVDAADANNVYLFIKQNSNDSDKDITESEQMITEIQAQTNAIKTMTSEIVVHPAVQVCFDLCAAPKEYARKYYFAGTGEDAPAIDEFRQVSAISDTEFENYIEITLDDNSIYVSSLIANSIAQIILEYMSVSNCRLGESIKIDEMLARIYAINGVQNVRTVFNPGAARSYTANGMQVTSKARAVDGLSFASWTKKNFYLSPTGIDLDVTNSIRHLESFQFPVPGPSIQLISNLVRKIRIIKKSLSNISTIKF